MGKDEHKVIVVAIENHGSLYSLLNGLITAVNEGIDTWQRSYDRRTDVIESASGSQAKIDALTEQIHKLGAGLKSAVDNQKGE